MIKKFLWIVMISILCFAAAGEGAEAEGKPPVFIVDGNAVVFNESTGIPYITNEGRTMMPLRTCLNSIGCDVDWNEQTKTVITSKGDREVVITVGKNEIVINQKAMPVDTAAIIKNDRTYLPLRTVLEAYGYSVDWDGKSGIVTASSQVRMEYTPFNINGGTTGIFSRKQLPFDGFSGVQADVTLPTVMLAEKGDCPYVYFGFDRESDAGNVEGGFQFIEDPSHPGYNKWTVFMRQGNEWRWGENIILEQGSTHHLKFYSVKRSNQQVDLVIALDGREIIRKVSAVNDFSNASVKAVTAMAMSKPFDGTNCLSRSEGAKITNLMVMESGTDKYLDFGDYKLYSEWKPSVGAYGMWFGTADCIPSYLHFGTDGTVSIFK
jgi:hypothetical protein